MHPSRNRLAEEVRRRRRELNLSQRDLGEQVQCSQSATSLFEAGQSDVLAAEKVRRLCEVLKIEFREPELLGREPALVLKYCPEYRCSNNRACQVAGRLRFVPGMIRADADVPTYCAACGTELQDTACPGCKSPLVEGAVCCMGCGQPYVVVPTELEMVPAGVESPGFVGPTEYRHRRPEGGE
jgi:transcriptional regulator with XRE-family HTH domain